jgi:hypothetical protein
MDDDMTRIQSRKSDGLNAKGRSGRSKRTRAQWGFVIMWEFKVRREMEKRFEEAYGSEGDWAELFGQDEAYVGTELIRHF